MTHFDFAPAMRYLPALLAGAGRTLELAAMSLTLGIALGIVLALARMSSVRLLRWPAYGCIEFFRTTPAMIQIIWCYFALPVVIQHDLNSFQATALALGLNAAAFLAEISRTGLQGVDAGQHDAVRVLGLSLVQGFCYVIVPQAVRIVLPTAAAMTVLIIKGTSLASAIGYLELTQIGQLVSTATFRPLETSSFVAVIYLMIGWPILRLARRLDRKGRLARILRLLG